jgi:hypothetical protein
MSLLQIKRKKPNGIPAFAGMTGFVERRVLNNNRHARAGGHPIFFFLMGAA